MSIEEFVNLIDELKCGIELLNENLAVLFAVLSASMGVHTETAETT